MILKGSQRAGAKQLAAHLLKAEENEHVEVHELRGFVADSLKGALNEAYAVSRGTRCKQFLFSLSLNPPETVRVSDRDFKRAIGAIERKLGLQGQPRAVVFHEKEGRRHAHCVWSRIDTDTMTAINLPHFKLKLRDISRALYIEHGWTMPLGLVDSAQRDPLNFTRAEWQQAQRAGHDPRALKAMFQECWAISDSRAAFARALEERGYYLARGDRRGYVALDFRGEVYAIAKWTGLRAKDVKAKLGNPQSLPSLDETRAALSARMTARIGGYIREAEAAFKTRSATLATKKSQFMQRHRQERRQLKERQDARRTAETNRRAARLPRGWRGLWDRITGKYARIRRENERAAFTAYRRDLAQKQSLIDRQLQERQALQHNVRKTRQAHTKDMAQLHRDVAHYMRITARQPVEARNHFREAVRQDSQHRSRGRRRRRKLTPDS